MQTEINKPYSDPTANLTDRVEALLEQMTLAEKIGQMTQVEKNSITPEDVTRYSIGSILSGGGGNPPENNAQNWREMVQSFARAALESRLGIPLIYGVDGVHGHSNVVGATIFPHNNGLGATRDAGLIERIAQATARELLATNVHWDFAPAVSVPQDVRWGRSYEGYSEDTDVVTELAMAYIRGLERKDASGRWVLPSVKHFVGDGGTTWGSTVRAPWLASSNWQGPTDMFKIDQGDTRVDEETLRGVHLAPYVEAIKAGVQNIMVSFSSYQGTKMHAHRYLLTDVIKNELGFEGFLVSDWMAIDQINESFYTSVVTSINAGLDMIMVPFDFKRFIDALTEAVNKGDVSQERIDDAVRRILRAKLRLGLFEAPLVEDISVDVVGSNEHREIAAEAVRKSLVLLKNDNAALPITSETRRVVVAGPAADDIGMACGGWTITWQGERGMTTQGCTLLDGIRTYAGNVEYDSDGKFAERADVGIVVVSEEPYAEGLGDKSDLSLTKEQKTLIANVRQQSDRLILVIYSGRPLIITDVVDQCDAIVAAWLPGTEVHAAADVLFGKVPFTGKLSYNWPRSMDQIPLAALKASDQPPLYPFGHGLQA
jgi:beta-glucosidase